MIKSFYEMKNARVHDTEQIAAIAPYLRKFFIELLSTVSELLKTFST